MAEESEGGEMVDDGSEGSEDEDVDDEDEEYDDNDDDDESLDEIDVDGECAVCVVDEDFSRRADEHQIDPWFGRSYLRCDIPAKSIGEWKRAAEGDDDLQDIVCGDAAHD